MVVVLALVLLATRSEPGPRRGALLAGGVALAGLLISLALVVLGFDDLLTRNLLAIWAPTGLLVAGGLAVPRPRFVGVAAAVILCLIGVVTAVGVAVDAVDGSFPAKCDHITGETFALGTTRVTCSATDRAGNRATDSFLVAVADRDGPVIKLPGPIMARAGSLGVARVKWSISAFDNVDGPVPVSCDHVIGSSFSIGDTTVSCWASDAAGNTSRGSFVVHVIP